MKHTQCLLTLFQNSRRGFQFVDGICSHYDRIRPARLYAIQAMDAAGTINFASARGYFDRFSRTYHPALTTLCALLCIDR